MKFLYYIILCGFYEKSGSDLQKAKLIFVAMQWLFFIGIPSLLINDYYGKEFYSKYVKAYMIIMSVMLIILNYLFLFRKSKVQRIIEKYEGKYPLIEKYPIGAYLLFVVIIPIILFAGIIVSMKYR
ncbi:hypothetical protein HYN59_01490 [Flavobacterium album]|uniref:Uncharacterized protein n=1 Tax=Flavobacterium album TaxID=2175091 RepID=A0A2S1QU57_9FLAO|nr:hypothetical protein [Flavobacterium album]AWH83869.1 hypothetical protein HYN59_01490 [Flavobacterium album]